jgi:hypothetical protein
MELEELKVIWDSRNKEPLFALTETDLHAIVQRRNQELNHCVACRYAAEISMGVACGILMLVIASVLAFGRAEWLGSLPWMKVASSPWDIAALITAAGIWFHFSIYMNLSRQRQQRCGETFESSLRGDIDRSLARVAFQIKIAQGIIWWGFIPVWVAAALWVAVLFRLMAAPAWSDVLIASIMAGAFVTTVSCQQDAIKERYQPHQRELESLRRKLADPQL